MNIEAVKKAISIPDFKQTQLLEIALTHPSRIYENSNLTTQQKDSQEREYRRLAILGDAILGAVVIDYLHQQYPDLNEGKLTGLKNNLVSQQALNLAFDFDPKNVLLCVLALDIEPKLKQAMEELEAELPDPDEEAERFDEWRKTKGQAWVKKITDLIGYNLQFSEAQKDLLKEYYKANKSLLEELNSGCQVSKAVRQEIEETLLLPVD